jgi:hypothetical protein
MDLRLKRVERVGGEASPRASYAPPCLKPFGVVRDLTAGGSSAAREFEGDLVGGAPLP